MVRYVQTAHIRILHQWSWYWTAYCRTSSEIIIIEIYSSTFLITRKICSILSVALTITIIWRPTCLFLCNCCSSCHTAFIRRIKWLRSFFNYEFVFVWNRAEITVIVLLLPSFCSGFIFSQTLISGLWVKVYAIILVLI